MIWNKVEKLILQNQNTELEISIDVHVGYYNQYNDEMRDLDFKTITINDQTIVERQVSGEITL